MAAGLDHPGGVFVSLAEWQSALRELAAVVLDQERLIDAQMACELPRVMLVQPSSPLPPECESLARQLEQRTAALVAEVARRLSRTAEEMACTTTDPATPPAPPIYVDARV